VNKTCAAPLQERVASHHVLRKSLTLGAEYETIYESHALEPVVNITRLPYDERNTIGCRITL